MPFHLQNPCTVTDGEADFEYIPNSQARNGGDWTCGECGTGTEQSPIRIPTTALKYVP